MSREGDYAPSTWDRNNWEPVFKAGTISVPIETHDGGSCRKMAPRWTARTGRFQSTGSSKAAARQGLLDQVMDCISEYPRSDLMVTRTGPTGTVYTAARLSPTRVEIHRMVPGDKTPSVVTAPGDSGKGLVTMICDEFASGFALHALFEALSRLARGTMIHTCPSCRSVSEVNRPGTDGLVTCTSPGCRVAAAPVNWYLTRGR